MRDRLDRKELMRFVVAGCGAVAVDGLSYVLLLKLGVPVFPAKYTGFLLGAIFGFIVQKLWTFKSRGAWNRELLKYAALYLVSALLNAAVNHAALSLGGPGWLAFLCATGASTVLNFIGQKWFVFR